MPLHVKTSTPINVFEMKRMSTSVNVLEKKKRRNPVNHPLTARCLKKSLSVCGKSKLDPFYP